MTLPYGSWMETDPICGKKVTPGPNTPFWDYRKKRHYFCSERCKQLFIKDRERLRLGELAKTGALLSKGRVRWGLA